MSITQDPVGEAFRAGDLQAARAAAMGAVRAAPRDAGLRWRLAEILLLCGEIARADTALDAVLEEKPGPAVLEFRRLLRAEQQRRDVYAAGRLPAFQGDDPTPAQRAALRALTLQRAGDAAGAAEAAAEAEALRPRITGTADGVGFSDLRDADDLLAPQLEVLTSGGDALWVPLERLSSLALEPIRRPRDLAFRRATLVLKDGTEGLVFLPLLYARNSENDAQRLGRETAWSEGEGPVTGTGLRLFLADGLPQDTLSLAEVTELGFA
ncbi:type VI secretion system accessory protein TagJ [Pseudoroseomonas cervicalis]|uniref:ImpE protein n=1 Tax=Pseudoroseomonas cervicalis ATCC 49957 TaxID=525371 RepID=D5RJQ5_9PROT|nr:type VI secretion system accessory protein TagJ [Pseudoroseomonas cervicalis]EFH12458.1 ImpE protein [Pseudoroseomonas cervicalis ATCC 49957]